MTPLIALIVFVTVVVVLAALNSRHTRGRGCCAPADPAGDLRMRDVNLDSSSQRNRKIDAHVPQAEEI